jgi:hypothetical protein
MSESLDQRTESGPKFWTKPLVVFEIRAKNKTVGRGSATSYTYDANSTAQVSYRPFYNTSAA